MKDIMQKTIFLIGFFLIMLSYSCRKTEIRPVGFFGDSRVQFTFMDTTGADYLMQNHLKPTDLQIYFYRTERDSMQSYYEIELKDNRYIVTLYTIWGGYVDIPTKNAKHKLFIGDHVVDTVQSVGAPPPDLPTPSWVTEENPYNFLAVYELFYNGKLLTPPQVDHEGNPVVHRIVVKEDF